MPLGDGTGPLWGRGRGWRCLRSYGLGYRLGRGRARNYPSMATYSTAVPPSTKEEEMQELRAYAEDLAGELEEIKKALTELGKRK
ncbi:MAG: DUF5320 domain-containing protein [Candidatus Micrarchaeota archaeon]